MPNFPIEPSAFQVIEFNLKEFMKKYKPVLVYLAIKQAENLRKLSFVRRESQSKIIRDMFDDFYSKPKAEPFSPASSAGTSPSVIKEKNE